MSTSGTTRKRRWRLGSEVLRGRREWCPIHPHHDANGWAPDGRWLCSVGGGGAGGFGKAYDADLDVIVAVEGFGCLDVDAVLD